MKDNIVNFPKDKIVKIKAIKEEGFHQKKIKKLLWELAYEFTKAYEAKELDIKEEFQFHNILPNQRDDKKYTKLMVIVYPTILPF